MSRAITCLSVKYLNSEEKPMCGCIAKTCPFLHASNAQEDRVLRHANECKHLCQELCNFASKKSASSSLGAQLKTVATTEDSTAPSHTPSVLSTLLSSSAKPKLSTGCKQFQLKIDFCVMKLICVCGLVPNLLDTDEWKEFMAVTNLRYKWTPSDRFERKYILQESWQVHDKVKEILKQEQNLMLTFDENSTWKPQSVYTMHITTKDFMSYFYGGYEGSDEHHMAEWGIRDIGEDNFSGLCSDSMGNAKKGKSLTKEIIMAIITLPDCCHHLHNTIKEIPKLPEFQKMMKLLKDTTKHFNLIIDQVIKIKNKEVMTAFTGQQANLEFQLALKHYLTIIGPLAHLLWALKAAQTNAADVYMFWLAIVAELRDIFSCPKNTGIEPELAKQIIHIFLRQAKSVKAIAEEFSPQLLAYSQGEYPVSDCVGSQTFFAIKIFSVLVNSMPDEHTGSKITWFNSPLWSNQKVSTLVNVGQWYDIHQPYLSGIEGHSEDSNIKGV
ncbi:hypothetical protein IW262DRAFT_1302855 [Armillaria fumosa]|nr:hypothetical protein IW262DRAFT_1302855 [Armillaria fumosa]